MGDYQLRRFSLLLGVLSSTLGGAVCLGLGTVGEYPSLRVIGGIVLGGAVVNVLFLLAMTGRLRRKVVSFSFDSLIEHSQNPLRLSPRDLYLLRRAQVVSADPQWLVAGAIVVGATAIGTGIVVIGALYSLQVVMASGVAVLVFGPVIGCGRMIIAEYCALISKLALLLREHGCDLLDQDADK